MILGLSAYRHHIGTICSDSPALRFPVSFVFSVSSTPFVVQVSSPVIAQINFISSKSSLPLSGKSRSARGQLLTLMLKTTRILPCYRGGGTREVNLAIMICAGPQFAVAITIFLQIIVALFTRHRQSEGGDLFVILGVVGLLIEQKEFSCGMTAVTRWTFCTRT